MNNLNRLEISKVNTLCLSVSYFQPNYHNSKIHQPIYQKFIDLYGDKYKKEIYCFLDNAMRCYREKSRGFKTPRDRMYWRRIQNKQKLSRTRFIHIITKLEQDGWIDLFLGGKNAAWSVTSFCWFTTKMDNLLGDKVVFKETPLYPCPVEIYRREDKHLLPTRGVSGVSELANVVDTYNHFLFDKEIEVCGVMVSTQQYKRSFLDTLDFGGRYYNVTGGVQTMKREWRADMKISGEEVIELDFKAMHLSMLYEASYANNKEEVEEMLSEWDGVYDPYLIESVDGIIMEDSDAARKQLRQLCKWAILVGLNGEDEVACRRALLYHYRTNHEQYNLLRYADKFPTGNIFNAVRSRNYLLADRFFSDVGVSLQRLEGDIMSEIIEHAINQEVVILPLHDAVICPVSKKDIVKEWMTKSYGKVLGNTMFCYIEEKKYEKEIK